MKKGNWRKKIKKACETAGTYQSFCDPIIDTLAGILEMRDDAQEKFLLTGGNTVVTHTNKAGQTNIVKNPALVVISEMNTQALQYWAALGLTIKAYKQIGGDPKTGGANAATVEDIFAGLGI